MAHQIFDKWQMVRFANYCESFYGGGGIYPLGCNRQDIEGAILKYLSILAKHPVWTWGFGDSVDRERVAEILCDKGFAYPELKGATGAV
jgi:hypothetical protein